MHRGSVAQYRKFYNVGEVQEVDDCTVRECRTIVQQCAVYRFPEPHQKISRCGIF